jgi:hypothetical protein
MYHIIHDNFNFTENTRNVYSLDLFHNNRHIVVMCVLFRYLTFQRPVVAIYATSGTASNFTFSQKSVLMSFL